jgi:hypothetical protein
VPIPEVDGPEVVSPAAMVRDAFHLLSRTVKGRQPRADLPSDLICFVATSNDKKL